MTTAKRLDHIHKEIAQPMGQLAIMISCRVMRRTVLQEMENHLTAALDDLRQLMAELGIPRE